MCGVFATTRPELWRQRTAAVLTALDHRGPDANGVWESPDGQVLMAHTRLAIIGLDEAGAQPAVSGDKTLAVTFNGEIYNFRELAGELGVAPARSDTAVLAELLAAGGPAAAGRMRGMWAFAAWDGRTGGLLTGRDPWGIKPLYVLHHASGGVTVCSEIPPLLLLEEARVVDPVGLAQYLAFGHTGPDVTMFEPIRKVAPGSVQRWGASGLERVVRPVPPPVEELSLAAAVEDSVAAHLVSDVEVGVFLSGGIDSTLVAAIARRLLPRLQTFTISFPDSPELDESARAAHNAGLIGTVHHTVPVRAPELVEAAARFVEVQGEPFGDAAALPLTVLAAAVRPHLKVVLTGEGGDEVVGGYGRYRISRRVGSPLLRGARLALTPGARWWGERRGDAPRSRALEAIAWGGGVRSHAALLGSDLTTMLNHDVPFAGEVDALVRADWEACRDPDDAEPEVARRFDRTRWLANTYLEKVDRATMASSVEARVPYLDAVVATAGARLPVDPRKQVLRDELCKRLPGVALPSRKKGLAVSVGDLLAAGLSSYAAYTVGSGDSVLCRCFGPLAVDALARRADRSPLTAFRLAMLGQWESTLGSAGLL